MYRRITHAFLDAGVLLLCAGIGGCLPPLGLESALQESIFRDPRFIVVKGDCYATDPPTRRDVEAEPGLDQAVPVEPPAPMDEFFRAGFGLNDMTQAKLIATALSRSRPSIVFVLYEDKADAPAAMDLANRLKANGLAVGLTTALTGRQDDAHPSE